MNEQYDLLSLVLTLQPVKTIPAADAENLPHWWGRAAHALYLDVVRQYDDLLAAELHDPESGSRPFTISTLIGLSTRYGLDSTAIYRLRLTALRADLVAHLLKAITPVGPLSPGSLFELDYIAFQVQSTEPEIQDPKSDINSKFTIQDSSSEWSALTSFQDLSAPYLLARQQAPRRVTLKFTSPTSFKSKGMHVPIPTQELVFGSLLERWNAFAPIAFPPEVKRYAEECLAISRFKLQSRSVPVKSRGIRVGGLGTVTYVSLNYDRYWMSVIRTLAEFALFSGVGAGTPLGLGQCKVEDG